MYVFRCAALLLLMVAGTVVANPLPQRNGQGLLVSNTGRTLYSYDLDTPAGESHCNESCAAVWPPYVADKGIKATGDYSVTMRADGAHQWAYHGHPLYLFAGDAKPGDRDGDGVNGSWHVVH